MVSHGSLIRQIVWSGTNPANASIYEENGQLFADCVDGKRFCIMQLMIDEKAVDQAGFREMFAGERVFLL